jgi:CHAT domain-containing protein
MKSFWYRVRLLILTLLLAFAPLHSGAQAPAGTGQKPPQSALSPAQQELESIFREGRKAVLRGDFSAATRTFEQGLNKAQALKDSFWTARFLDALGDVYNSLGQYEQALEPLNRALRLFESLRFDWGIAESLNNLGNVHFNLDQSEQALEAYSAALMLLQQRNIPDFDPYIARVLDNLGILYADMGQYARAIEYHTRALEIRKRLGSDPEIAISLTNLGNIYIYQDKYAQALECYIEAQPLFERLGNDRDTAADLTNMGSAYAGLGQYLKAHDFYERALEKLKQPGNERDRAEDFTDLGVVYSTIGQYTRVLEYHTRALEIRQKLGNDVETAASLECLGQVYRQMGKPDRAEAAFADARRHFEAVSAQVRDPTQLGAFQSTLFNFYNHYARLLVERKRLYDALVLADSGRARGLAFQAARSHTDLSVLFSSEDARRWQTAHQETVTADSLLAAAEQRLQQAEDADKPTAQTQHNQALQRVLAAERQLALLQSEIYQHYPRFRQLRGANPLTPAQIRTLAQRHADTLNLEYAISDEKTTLLFALSAKDGLHVFPIPLGLQTLKAQTDAWSAALTAPAQLLDPSTPPNKKAALARQMTQEPHYAHTLFDALIQPLDKAGLLRPGRYAHLVIVPDGPLLTLPFAALLDAQGHRLSERFPLSLSVSLGLLVWLNAPRTAPKTLFFAADPTGPQAERLANQGGILQQMGGRAAPLPLARQGAMQVAQMFPGALGLEGAQARKSEVLHQMPQYDLLLFATHGYLVPDNGLRSWLLLASEQAGSIDDNRLTAREVLGLHLSARLAFLMACQSGLGEWSGGEGLLGLVWAFWGAGCPSVVASQWEVEQEATERLTVAFYRGLKAGKSKDEAMQAAMASVRGDRGHPEWPLPFYWASFTVYGDTSPLPATLRNDGLPRRQGGQ